MGRASRSRHILPAAGFPTGLVFGLALVVMGLPCPGHAGQLQQLRDDVRDDSSKDRDDRDDDRDGDDGDYYGCGTCGGDYCDRHWNNDPAGYFLSELLGIFFFPNALDWHHNQCHYRDEIVRDHELRPDDSSSLCRWPRRVVHTVCGAATSPFWLPRWAVDDCGITDCDFSRFPYEHGQGYMLINRCVDVPRLCAIRLRSDYAEDFDDLSRISGHLLVSTTSRWGLDTEMNELQERLPNHARDRLWLGDCNLIYRFAQSERSQWRAGIGFNWLDDPIETNYGFNFTYGFDLFPVKPLVLSTELDWGTLGSAEAFHFRTTAGVVIRRLETYVGYEYRDIDSFQFNGLVAGVRIWF